MCTIHQPSLEVFAVFTHLLLISNGQSVFFGPTDKCKEHFELKFGYSCSYQNVADFALFVSSGGRESRGKATLDELPSGGGEFFWTKGNLPSRANESVSARHEAAMMRCRSSAASATSPGGTLRQADSSDFIKHGHIILTIWHRQFTILRRKHFYLSIAGRGVFWGLLSGLSSFSDKSLSISRLVFCRVGVVYYK
jgi:hypothetical protein